MKRMYIAKMLGFMVFALLFVISACFGCNDVVYGCYQKISGQLRVVENHSSCTNAELPIFIGGSMGNEHVITVDCDNGETVNEALSLAPPLGRVTISINGSCTESVVVHRNEVTLRGTSSESSLCVPNENSDVLEIFSNKVQIEHLTIKGGAIGIAANWGGSFSANDVHVEGAADIGFLVANNSGADIYSSSVQGSENGVVVTHSSAMTMDNCQVEDSSFFGIKSEYGGHLQLNNSIVRNSGFHGAYAANSGSIALHETTIEGSTGFGAHADSAGLIMLGEGSIVQTTSGHGVLANDGGVVRVIGDAKVALNNGHGIVLRGGHLKVQNNAIIENNDSDGIFVFHNSSASIESGSIIRQNNGNGICINDTSTASFSNDVHVENNGGTGISCQSANAIIYGNPFVLGNAGGQINCP